MTYVKVCGIRRTEDVINANRVRPDLVGFIFFGGSKRYVSPYQAVRLARGLDPAIQTVGIFVDEAADVIASICESDSLDWIQLHGKEDNAFIRDLRTKTGARIMKTFFVRSAADVDAARDSEADLVMFASPNGFGTVFDWSCIHDIGRDYVISGGLNRDNVGDVVRKYRPRGVDVSTGVESDASKSWSKMSDFMDAVREADLFS